MSKSSFKIRLQPEEALQLVRGHQNADLVHSEFHSLDNGKAIGTLIFEKYYFRSKNRACLVVIIENLQDTTEVRAVSTGSSEGLFFNFDWGAADNFVRSVEEILEDYRM